MIRQIKHNGKLYDLIYKDNKPRNVDICDGCVFLETDGIGYSEASSCPDETLCAEYPSAIYVESITEVRKQKIIKIFDGEDICNKQ